jgi:hypothetical protein
MATAKAVGPTKLAYFDDMWALRSHATVLAAYMWARIGSPAVTMWSRSACRRLFAFPFFSSAECRNMNKPP